MNYLLLILKLKTKKKEPIRINIGIAIFVNKPGNLGLVGKLPICEDAINVMFHEIYASALSTVYSKLLVIIKIDPIAIKNFLSITLTRSLTYQNNLYY